MVQRQIGIALFSGSLLFFEIALTRFYSVLYYPPVVFAILTVALLGISLGAATVALSERLRTEEASSTSAALVSLAMTAALLVTTLGVGRTAEVAGWMAGFLTFFCAGLLLSALYSAWSQQSTRLYAADLAGAGLGALLAVPVLTALAPPVAMLLAALLTGSAAFLFASKPSRAGLPVTALALAALALTAGQMSGQLAVDLARLPTDKPVRERLASGGDVVATDWDGFARADLIDPGGGAPYELYLDGAAGSVMPPAAGHPSLWRDIGFFPFATEQPASVFVVGAGAGLELWFARQSGVEAITASEVSRGSVRLTEEASGYNGALTQDPFVRLVVDEGRSLLAREAHTYDLISLSQVVTSAAERDGYALVENDAYTLEAFDLYLSRLNDDGTLALKLYDEITLARAFTTVMRALMADGLDQAAALSHLLILVDPSVEPAIPLLLVRKNPFTQEEATAIGAVAVEVGFTPLFLPQRWAQAPMDALASGEQTLAEYIESSDADLMPTTDKRPFFFQFERGIPATLARLLIGVTLFAMAIVCVAIWAGRRAGNPVATATSLYFALLGFGFIVVEIVLIQQVRLFVGHPTYAIAVVLGSLLVCGGLGSAVVGERTSTGSSTRMVQMAALAVSVLLLSWTLLWPNLSAWLAAAPLVLRLLAVTALMAPIGFAMGIPFPMGLRLAGRQSRRAVALAWTVNGSMSVLGSVLAVAVAIVAGFSMVAYVAASAYLLVAFVVSRTGDDTPGGRDGAA